MQRRLVLGIGSFLLVFGLFGCSNTEKGLEQDTAQNSQSVSQATDKAAQDVAQNTKEAAKNTTAAIEVTPKVKDAIMADPELRDSRNHINVDSKDGVVHLKGTVYNEAMKKKAEEIAQKALNDMNSTDKLSNELTVAS